MEESEFFDCTGIKPHNICIKSNSFDFGFGKNKNEIEECNPTTSITVEGFGYYNCEKPKAKDKCSRYYLELKLVGCQEEKTLVTIMLNPSNTFSNKIDSTVKNVVRIAYRLGYSKFIILNSFNYIDGNSKTAKEQEQKFCSDYDLQIISNVVNKNKNLMIAWGTKITKGKENSILKKLNNIQEINLFAYAWNEKSNCPYHPASRVNSQKSHPLTNFFLGIKDIVPLEIVQIQEDKYILKKT